MTKEEFLSEFTGEPREITARISYCHGKGDPAFPVWSQGFFDLVSLDADMFHAFRHYTKDNPRRKQLRDENRALFRKVRDARHPRLPSNRRWTAVGDLALLDYPQLVPVIVHRRRSAEETENTISHFVDLAASGAILIGGHGAIFWMCIIAFFGMATIYAEAVLAQETRTVDTDGNAVGGPCRDGTPRIWQPRGCRGECGPE